VPGDTNGVEDVFVYEWQAGTLSRVSVSSSGLEGNGMSVQPSISADGRYVAFVSLADNLVEGDTNSASDIFVRDRHTGQTTLASISDRGEVGDGSSKYPVLSADGRFVAFQSKSSNLAADDTNQLYDVFVRDRAARTTELVSRGPDGVGNHESQRPTISDDGRYVAFESWARNLVPDDHNRYSDVFVADRETDVIKLVSVTPAGEQATNVSGGAVISSDGRFVAFASRADNLSPEDQNLQYDVYLHTRRTGTLTLISRNLNGHAGNGSSISPALTTSGNYIVFDSLATDLVRDDRNERVDVFVFDAYANAQLDYVVNLPFLVGQEQQRLPGAQLGSAGH
jgi:Tol biopolymer transport system component